MSFPTADVQMPVRRRLVSVSMGMAVDARQHTPRTDRAERDEHQPAEQFAAAFDDERERPSEQEQRAGTHSQQHSVADRKPHRDAERARAFDRRRFATRSERKRRDRHEVIGAQTVKKAERESRGQQQQDGHRLGDFPPAEARSGGATVHATGTLTGA